MTRDFAKKPLSEKSKSGSKTWLISLFFIVFIILGLVYLMHYKKTVIDNPVPSNKTAEMSKIKPPKQTEPQFDFYTMLPELSLPAPVLNDTKEETSKKKFFQRKKKPATIVSPSDKQYVLQVASFRHYNDADHMKAQLTLQGHHVTVKKIQQNQTTWYRVLVGPYPSHLSAEKQQTQFKQQKIDSLVYTYH